MNISLVTQAFGVGGAQKMMAFVVNTLAPIASKITLILTEDVVEYDFPENVYTMVITPFTRKTGTPLDKILELRHIAKETQKIVKEEKTDVLIGFGAYFATVCVLAARGTECKVIGSERRAPSMMTKIWQKISRMSYAKCDRVVFQLEGARDFYSNIPIEMTCIIPNPFISKWGDLPQINQRRKIVCMAAARLEYEKGFDIGILAMKDVVKKHPEYKMEIYGAGDFFKMYGTLITNWGLDNYIEYKGLSKTIIEDIYDTAVFVLPSRSEGIPNMLLETMAAGMPCVAADCPPGGPRMLIDNNKNGIIVPVENPKAMAQAICQIIEDNDFSARIGENAKEVRDRFNPNIIKVKWINAVKDLCR